MPSGSLVVLAVQDEVVVLSDGGTYHYTHFFKDDESPLKAETQVPETLLLLDEDEDEEDSGYLFREDELLSELHAYIDKTYGEHYAKDGVQAFSLISKRPDRGLQFCMSNITKYSDRFGEKGGMNRKDILKCAHYSLLALYCLDKLKETKNG